MECWRYRNAGYHRKFTGVVIELVDRSSAKEIPSGGYLVVRYEDENQLTQTHQPARFNSAGRTVFSDRKIGDSVEFYNSESSTAPGPESAYGAARCEASCQRIFTNELTDGTALVPLKLRPHDHYG
jgi:hypothetical protein